MRTGESLHTVLERNATASQSALASGSIASHAFGTQSTSLYYGRDSVSQTDLAHMWSELLDDFEQASAWLRKCARYGQDAWTSLDSVINTTTVSESAVVVDTSSRWADACDTFGIDSAKVVGQAVGDDAVFVWLMVTLQPVTEVRCDFTYLRTA